MRIALTLPQLGLTQTEGSVAEWLKQPGDAVKKDEIVFIVSTDKAEMEIEAPADGVMGEILVDPGITVAVGTPLAWFEREGGEEADGDSGAAESEPAAAPVERQDEPIAAAVAADGAEDGRRQRVAASPRARRVARELGVDVGTLQGSGPGGRITEEDVRAAAQSAAAAAVAASAAPARREVARRRQIIADRMTESIRTIPSFSVSVEVNAARLVDLYESVGERVAAAGTRLSYTDLLMKCVARALEETPELNATWTEDGPVARTSADVNLAMATDRGVTAPVIRSAGTLPLQRLAEMRAALARKAREGHLSPAELENGGGTLSNLGMYAVDSFEGIITPGQSFIVSAGRLARRPWVEMESLTVQPTLRLTLSVDHRVADGAQGAIFLGRIAGFIEKPLSLLWENQ